MDPSSHISLEQAEAFDAIARLGTFQKAAESLNKGHSAVLYLIKSLETQLDLELLDRTGYRNQLTARGQVVLKFCKRLLETKQELLQTCAQLKGHWEPSLTLVYDGVVDFDWLADALVTLQDAQVPTELKVLGVHLDKVEKTFESEKAELILTILPIKNPFLNLISLPRVRMCLVAHRSHALGQANKTKISAERLKRHTYLKISGARTPLGFSTDHLDFSSSFFVNDFPTKKQAIMRGLGYGWLPEYMIKKELQSKELIWIKTDIENSHSLMPVLYHRKEELIGKATQQLISFFRSLQK